MKITLGSAGNSFTASPVSTLISGMVLKIDCFLAPGAGRPASPLSLPLAASPLPPPFLLAPQPMLKLDYLAPRGKRFN